VSRRSRNWGSTATNDFDFVLGEVVDSFRILEMITSIENKFHIKLDIVALDADRSQ